MILDIQHRKLYRSCLIGCLTVELKIKEIMKQKGNLKTSCRQRLVYKLSSKINFWQKLSNLRKSRYQSFLILSNFADLDGSFSWSNWRVRGRPSTLAMGNERFWINCICKADCLTYSASICNEKISSNITNTLRAKCPNTELFLVRIKENTDQ